MWFGYPWIIQSIVWKNLNIEKEMNYGGRKLSWGDKHDKTWKTIWTTIKFIDPTQSLINQREGVWWKDITGLSERLGRDVWTFY